MLSIDHNINNKIFQIFQIRKPEMNNDFVDTVALERIEKNNGLLRKKKHDLDWLTAENIKPYLKYDQRKAAEKLNISISTLKRHFYKLNLGRWPIHRPSAQDFLEDEDDEEEDEELFEFSFNSWEGQNSTNIHNMTPIMTSHELTGKTTNFNDNNNRIKMNIDLNNHFQLRAQETHRDQFGDRFPAPISYHQIMKGSYPMSHSMYNQPRPMPMPMYTPIPMPIYAPIPNRSTINSNQIMRINSNQIMRTQMFQQQKIMKNQQLIQMKMMNQPHSSNQPSRVQPQKDKNPNPIPKQQPKAQNCSKKVQKEKECTNQNTECKDNKPLKIGSILNKNTSVTSSKKSTNT